MQTLRTIGLFFVICLLGLFAYGPVLKAPYIYDDHRLIQMSQRVFPDSPDGTVERSITQQVVMLYKQPRPLRQLSHVLDRKLFGESPAPAHVVNVLLHVVVAFLGYLLLKQIGMTRDVTALAPLLFLLLPMCVESVAVISHRKEMLAALFLLLGLRLAFQGTFAAWTGAGLCLTLAVTGKETAIVFPLLFLVLTIARHHRHSDTHSAFNFRTLRVVGLLLLFALILGFFIYLQVRISKDDFAAGQVELPGDRQGHLQPNASWGLTIRVAMWAFARYLLMLASPWGHTLQPALPLEGGFFSAGFAAILLMIVAFAAAVIVTWRRRQVFCAPLMWMFVSLSIVLFPPLLRSGSAAIYADRYAYLAAFGYAWLMASALSFVRQHVNLNMARGLALALLTFYGVGTYRIAQYFTSESALWTRVLELNPANYQAEYNLAFAEWKESKNFERALTHFHRMSAINPKFEMGHCAFADCYAESGSIRQAIQVLGVCLNASPNSVRVYALRGMYSLMANDVEAAAADFAQAIRLGGNDPILLHNFGLAQEKRARWREAAFLFSRSARHPAFRKDAERIKLLTGDQPSARPTQKVLRNLVVDAAVSAGLDTGKTPNARRLADILMQRLKQSGIGGFQFVSADLPRGPEESPGTALNRLFNNKASFANCIILVISHRRAPKEDASARIRQIADCVMVCRMNRVRPLVVYLESNPAPDGLGAPGPEELFTNLHGQLDTFCRESGLVFMDFRSHQNPRLPDGISSSRGETTTRETTAELENIGDRILGSLLPGQAMAPLHGK